MEHVQEKTTSGEVGANEEANEKKKKKKKKELEELSEKVFETPHEKTVEAFFEMMNQSWYLNQRGTGVPRE